MDIRDVNVWERCKELAKRCGVIVELRGVFSMTASDGRSLGGVETTEELYAFLCGYEHCLGRSLK